MVLEAAEHRRRMGKRLALEVQKQHSGPEGQPLLSASLWDLSFQCSPWMVGNILPTAPLGGLLANRERWGAPLLTLPPPPQLPSPLRPPISCLYKAGLAI